MDYKPKSNSQNLLKKWQPQSQPFFKNFTTKLNKPEIKRRREQELPADIWLLSVHK